MLAPILLLAAALAGPPSRPDQAAPLKVVASPHDLWRHRPGDRGRPGSVTSIAKGDEDPHFVQPKPSFVSLLRDADLFVTTGLDLGLWVPALLDRAGNRKIQRAGPVRRRVQGDRLARDPHVVEPLGGRHPRGRQPAHSHRSAERHHHRPQHPRGTEAVSPQDGEYFSQREQDFERRVLEATMGQELVQILTPPPRSACFRATSSTAS